MSLRRSRNILAMPSSTKKRQSGSELALYLQTPNGGEQWIVNEERHILWSSDGMPDDTFKIELSRDNGSSWVTLAAAAPNTGSFTWIVDGNMSKLCLVRITSNEHVIFTKTSISNFTINPYVYILNPLGEVTWTWGTVNNIVWGTQGNTGANIIVEFSQINGLGGIWITLATTADDGQYEWTIPYILSYLTSTCRIRISVQGYSGSLVYCDSTFIIITPPLVVVEDFSGYISGNDLTTSPKWTRITFGADYYGQFLNLGGGNFVGRFYDENVTQDYNYNHLFPRTTPSGIHIVEFRTTWSPTRSNARIEFALVDASNNQAIKIEYRQTSLWIYNSTGSIQIAGFNPQGNETIVMWFDTANKTLVRFYVSGVPVTIPIGYNGYVNAATGQISMLKFLSEQRGDILNVDDIKINW